MPAHPPLVVLLDVEVEEEAEEDDHEGGGDERELPRVAAVADAEDDHAALDEDHGELDHLEGGQVLLPPEVLLHVWAQGGQEVVGVHDDVHDGVHEAAERLLASGQPAHEAIGEDGHDTMMENLQKENLFEAFCRYNQQLELQQQQQQQRQ